MFCACDTPNFFIVRIQIIIHRWRKKEKTTHTHAQANWEMVLLFLRSFFRENFTYIKLFHDAVYHIICHIWFWMWRIFNKKHFNDATANKRMGTGKKIEILMLRKENWLLNQNAKEAKQRWKKNTHTRWFHNKEKET